MARSRRSRDVPRVSAAFCGRHVGPAEMLVETLDISVGLGYLICDRLIDRPDLCGRRTLCEWALGAALCGGL
jgi:hypothetical protein